MPTSPGTTRARAGILVMRTSDNRLRKDALRVALSVVAALATTQPACRSSEQALAAEAGSGSEKSEASKAKAVTSKGAAAKAAAEKAPRPPAGPPRSPLGTELDGIAEWSPQRPFINLVRQARKWVIQREGAPWGQGGKVDQDDGGWIIRMDPDQSAELLFSIGDGRAPEPAYLVKWSGRGEISLNPELREAGKPPRGWRMRVEPIPTKEGGHLLGLKLDRTDPKDPLRDIVIVAERHREAYERGERFNPDMIARLEPYSALRFMSWGATNNSWMRKWSSRPKPTDMTWSYKGVPVEIMLELMRTVDADGWFNIPHRADDDYIRRFAQAVKAGLPKGRIAFFELSNELWNWGFTQASYANREGRLRWRNRGVLKDAIAEAASGPSLDLSNFQHADDPLDLEVVVEDARAAGLEARLSRAMKAKGREPVLVHVLNRMMDEAPGDAYMQWAGMRAAQMCDIVKGEVFADAPERVRCVLAAHAFGGGVERAVLGCPAWEEAPCAKHGFDDFAITAYLGANYVSHGNTPQIKKWAAEGAAGIPKALAELERRNKLPDNPEDLKLIGESVARNAGIAKRHGLRLVAYEAGQHVRAHQDELLKDKEVQALLLGMNRHPKMGELYTGLLDTWKANGGTLFMHFVDISQYGRYGSWGALEDYAVESPKYRALVQWAKAHPRWF